MLLKSIPVALLYKELLMKLNRKEADQTESSSASQKSKDMEFFKFFIEG